MVSFLSVSVSVGGVEFDDFAAAAKQVADDLYFDTDSAVLAAGQEIMRTLRKVGEAIAAKHANPWNGGIVNQSQFLQARSGGGLRSILQSIRQTDNTGMIVGGQITTGSLSVHETGATITPKSSKYLTIPLPAAMDSRGVALKQRAQDWQNTFVAKSKRGNLIIFQRNGRNVIPLYLLKSSVTIPARLGMGKEIDGILPYFERQAFEAISTILGTGT